MHGCIVYSSCSGNTRTLAAFLTERTGLPCYAVRSAPDPQGYDLLALGFWVRKGLPDGRSLRYMAQLRGKNLFLFGTMGAWPDSDHAKRCLVAANSLLTQGGNVVFGSFLCQGRVNPRIVAVTQRKGTHPPSPERLKRLQEATRHPNTLDCHALWLQWQHALSTLAAPMLPSSVPYPRMNVFS